MVERALARRVLLAIGFGTALSLMGDSSLYVVLPTHTLEAGVALASVGVLLSANRFIRLALNGPIGALYDRLPRRWLFVSALFLGALSTALYALVSGFWPLLAARLLWGLSWAGIWVGGNTILLDVSTPATRGRLVGLYNVAFFLGASNGALTGGLLTDWLGYRNAMAVAAAGTLLGGLAALLWLPETRPLEIAGEVELDEEPPPPARFELASATALLGVNRLALAGLLQPTFGLFLLGRLGRSLSLDGTTVGVATLTGLGLGAGTLVSMLSAPLAGSLSDRARSRWTVAAAGLLPGAIGFALMARGAAPLIGVGLLLAAVTSGSNQGLSTALVGDLGARSRKGRSLGWLFTVGDLASAAGPPAAYALIVWLEIETLYLIAGGLFAAMMLVALRWALVRRQPAREGALT